MKYGIGIWGTSKHSTSKIYPNIKNIKKFNFVGYLSRNSNNVFLNSNEYKIYDSKKEFLSNPNMQFVVIATPPALHYQNAMEALTAGKNIIVEKPISQNKNHTFKLIEKAKELNLLIIEAYYYKYHNQYKTIKNKFLENKKEIFSITSKFGIPKLERDSFRDKLHLGASAFWDIGYYPISLISDFFDLKELKVISTNISPYHSNEIDVCGTSILISSLNQSIILQWGMGMSYQNSIDIWGKEFHLQSDFIFSKPDDINTTLINRNKNGIKQVQKFPFTNSIKLFYETVINNFDSNDFKNEAAFNIEKITLLQELILESAKNFKNTV